MTDMKMQDMKCTTLILFDSSGDRCVSSLTKSEERRTRSMYVSMYFRRPLIAIISHVSDVRMDKGVTGQT